MKVGTGLPWMFGYEEPRFDYQLHLDSRRLGLFTFLFRLQHHFIFAVTLLLTTLLHKKNVVLIDYLSLFWRKTSFRPINRILF